MTGRALVALLAALLAAGASAEEAEPGPPSVWVIDADAERYYEAWGLPRPSAADLEAVGSRLMPYGRTDEAEAAFEEALRIDPEFHLARFSLAKLYRRLGDGPKAEETFEALTAEGNPYAARAHNNLGRLAASQARRDEALEHFQQAVSLDPEHLDARLNLGLAFLYRQRYPEALEQFEVVIERKPNPVMAHIYRARIFDADGREDDAVAEYERILVLDPAHPRALYNIAVVHERHGRVVLAREYYTRALRSAQNRRENQLVRRIRHAMRQL